MPRAKSVPIALSRREALDVGAWLLDAYRPGDPPFANWTAWRDEQRAVAHAFGRMLLKSARRKRPTPELRLQVDRHAAQWFAAFSAPGGWWDDFPGQPAPEGVVVVANRVRRTTFVPRGRPGPKILADEARRQQKREQLRDAGDADARAVRRAAARLKRWREAAEG